MHYNIFFIWFKVKNYLDVVAVWWSKYESTYTQTALTPIFDTIGVILNVHGYFYYFFTIYVDMGSCVSWTIDMSKRFDTVMSNNNAFTSKPTIRKGFQA